jgi:hypothetical protein
MSHRSKAWLRTYKVFFMGAIRTYVYREGIWQAW